MKQHGKGMVTRSSVGMAVRSGFLLTMLLLIAMATYAQQQRLFLIAGQSNAVGQGDQSASIHCKPGTAFEYSVATDSLSPLQDPAGYSELNFEKARTGSIAPAFASLYHQLTGNEVIIVTAARGGSSCHEKAELENYGTWAANGRLPLFNSAVEKVNRVRYKTKLPLSGVIWLQGERDANAINDRKLTAEEYKQALQGLIVRFRKALQYNVPFYIVLTGYYKDHTNYGFDCVREQQEKVAREDPDTYIVYRDTNLFIENGWMKDAIHYNQEGLNAIGSTIAAVISKQVNKQNKYNK
jgi:lysophospholipase L1-like esterase